MRKVRNDDKNKDINCIRCFSRNHDTTQCRRYIATSMYMCICEEGYHYRDKCLTRKDSRRNSIEDNYRNRTQSRQRQNSSERMRKKDRLEILVEKIEGNIGKMIHKDIVMTNHIRRNKKLCTDIDRLAHPLAISICVYFMIKKHLQI